MYVAIYRRYCTSVQLDPDDPVSETQEHDFKSMEVMDPAV